MEMLQCIQKWESCEGDFQRQPEAISCKTLPWSLFGFKYDNNLKPTSTAVKTRGHVDRAVVWIVK